MAIVYIGPSVSVPVGGLKVLYRQVEMLRADGLEAYMWHPDSAAFRCTWFESSAPMWPGRPLDPERDLVVVPEVWASSGGRQCREAGVRYAIFVQNGYYIRHWQPGCGVEDLLAAYQDASIVMCISESTARLVRAAYPFVPEDRMLMMLPDLSDTFVPRPPKERRITCMPRKLPIQSELLACCLEHVLPAGWSLEMIDGRSEREVEDLLGSSSVFLSISDLEGFGLPPLEAALSGNLVVGYTGQGAKAYFDRPIFRAVEHGDIPSFLDETLRAIQDVEAGLLGSPEVTGQAEALRRRYGRQAQRAGVRRFAQRVAEVMAGEPLRRSAPATIA